MKYESRTLSRWFHLATVFVCTAAIALSQSVDPERASLEKQKLKAEIAKLETENENLLDPWAEWTPRITAILGVLGALGAAFKYLDERRKDREQRIDQDFGGAVAALASDRPPARVSAAVSMVRFAGAQFGERRRIAIDVLLAQLRLTPPEQEQRILAESFSRALDQVGDYRGLNASDAMLSFAHLKANLQNARFDKIKADPCLFENCRLENAVFTSATLTNVRFVNCNLTNAWFADCKFDRCEFGADTVLAGAVFDHCSYLNTDFSAANVTGAKFQDVRDLDLNTAKSLAETGVEMDVAFREMWRRKRGTPTS